MFTTCGTYRKYLLVLQSKSGKFDLLQHTKGVRSSRPFLILKEVIQEIIHGPDTPHCHRTQQHWSRCLHHIFFCKSFVFNTHFVQREVDEEKLSKTMGSFKAQCHPIPDFHPHLYFDLSDEFGWAEFLGEVSDAGCLSLSVIFFGDHEDFQSFE